MTQQHGPLGITVELEGVDELRKALDPRVFAKALEQGVKIAGAHLSGEIAEVTPVNKETTTGTMRGRLADSWRPGPVGRKGKDMVVVVGSNAVNRGFPYGIGVNFGTGIYGPRKQRIRPNTAKALRFVVGGRVVFARSVKGQRGQHFVEKGMKNAKRDIPRIIMGAIMNEYRKRGMRARGRP